MCFFLAAARAVFCGVWGSLRAVVALMWLIGCGFCTRGAVLIAQSNVDLSYDNWKYCMTPTWLFSPPPPPQQQQSGASSGSLLSGFINMSELKICSQVQLYTFYTAGAIGCGLCAYGALVGAHNAFVYCCKKRYCCCCCCCCRAKSAGDVQQDGKKSGTRVPLRRIGNRQ